MMRSARTLHRGGQHCDLSSMQVQVGAGDVPALDEPLVRGVLEDLGKLVLADSTVTPTEWNDIAFMWTPPGPPEPPLTKATKYPRRIWIRKSVWNHVKGWLLGGFEAWWTV